MHYKQYLVVIPGIVLAFVLYTLSQGFNNIVGIEILGYEKSPISTAMIAILFGMFFGNIFQMRNNILKGLDFTQKYILKIQANGTAILVTDHNVKNLFDITDRSYILGEQTVIAEGTPTELLRSSRAIKYYFGSQFS